MPKYTVLLSKKAQKQLDAISENQARPIFETILALADNPRLHGCIKLKGRDGYRIRVGNCRIIYEITDSRLIVDVIAIGDRKDVYR